MNPLWTLEIKERRDTWYFRVSHGKQIYRRFMTVQSCDKAWVSTVNSTSTTGALGLAILVAIRQFLGKSRLQPELHLLSPCAEAWLWYHILYREKWTGSTTMWKDNIWLYCEDSKLHTSLNSAVEYDVFLHQVDIDMEYLYTRTPPRLTYKI